MAYRTIECEKDIEEGVRHLVGACRWMRRIHDEAGLPPLRRVDNNFRSLANVVVSQQLSVASANAILTRVLAAVKPFNASRMLGCEDETLRSCGLSGAKIKTLKALSKALQSRQFAFRALAQADEAHVQEKLTTVHGIGPWTANIYIMFCLGRADAFAAGDLALQNTAMELMDLPERPTAKQLEELAETWRPWRGVAARMLWHYYRWTKDREGVAV